MELNSNYDTTHLRTAHYTKTLCEITGKPISIELLCDQLSWVQSKLKTERAVEFLRSTDLITQNGINIKFNGAHEFDWIDYIIAIRKPILVLGFPGNYARKFANDLADKKQLYIDHEVAWKLLIDKSITSIKMISPFFDVGGVNFFGGSLVNALKKNVVLNIISRNFQENQINSRMIAFKKICRIVYDECGYAKFNIGLFHDGSSDNTQEKHLGSVHAKFLLCDTRMAYTGSGEFRKGSARSNLEIGFINNEIEKIEGLVQVFEIFWNMCNIHSWRDFF
jgi:hypothetical protein